VIAPSIIADLGIGAVWIGVYFGVLALAALVTQLGCGSFIVRYGALRVSQVALVMLCAGCALAALGTPLAFVLSAIIGGGGGAVSTPASSHLLSRVSSPRYLPLVFSIKQTAVPAGLLLAGLLGPPLAEWVGWRATMLVAAAVCVVLALLLQPLRERFDDDRVPTRAFRLSDFRTTLSAVLATRELRTLSYACLAFNGLQTVMTA
jgi:MFS family permease